MMRKRRHVDREGTTVGMDYPNAGAFDPLAIADALLEARLHALTVVAQSLGGTGDETLWSRCLEEQRSLLDLDLEFSDVRFYLPSARYGSVVFLTTDHSKLRLAPPTKQIVPPYGGSASIWGAVDRMRWEDPHPSQEGIVDKAISGSDGGNNASGRTGDESIRSQCR
jgi:hypothetical protein